MKKLFFWSPLLSLGYFYLFIGVVSCLFGYIPQYGTPDPTNTLNELAVLSVYAFWILALVSLAYSSCKILLQIPRFIALTLVQGAFFFGAFVLDPLHLLEWFLD